MDPKAKAKKKAKRQHIREKKAQIESSREGFAKIMEDCLDRVLPKPLPVMPMCSLKPIRVDTSKKPETKIQEMYRHAKYFKELGASLTKVETTQRSMLGRECTEFELTIRTINKDMVEELVDISQDQY